MDDDWARCDAEAVVAALSVRTPCSFFATKASCVHAEAEHDDDVEEVEAWGSEEQPAARQRRPSPSCEPRAAVAHPARSSSSKEEKNTTKQPPLIRG